MMKDIAETLSYAEIMTVRRGEPQITTIFSAQKENSEGEMRRRVKKAAEV